MLHWYHSHENINRILRAYRNETRRVHDCHDCVQKEGINKASGFMMIMHDFTW